MEEDCFLLHYFHYFAQKALNEFRLTVLLLFPASSATTPGESKRIES